MSRELKFRAWSPKRKRFLYLDFGAIVDEPHLKDWNLAGAKEQFVGIKDKNGKDVYEGDIVEDCEEDLAVIRFGLDGTLGYYLDWLIPCYTKIMLTESDSSLFKVVGNIHENPELLKEKE